MFRFRVLLVLACVIYQYRINADTARFFRRDYTLFNETKTFYKLHTDRKSWNEARKLCIMEGSTLTVPETAAEAKLYLKMMEPTEEPYSDVYLGIQAFTKGLFTTLDGTPLSEVFHEWSPGEPNDYLKNEYCVTMTRRVTLNDVNCDRTFQFICEKSQDAVKWNDDCQVADPAYHRLDGMKNCYKLHLKPTNWLDAYATCMAEQSYLAIPNREEESKALKKLFDSESPGKVRGGKEIIHLGFYDRYKEGEFTTIQGIPLAEAGFDQWATGQPDHPGEETCGAMLLNGKLTDVNCDERSYFICEREDDLALSLRKKG